jgi:hypothetical protein
MSTKRLYRVKYLYRVKDGTVYAGTERKASLRVEQPNIATALKVGTTLARRCCKALGDEIFLRVLGVRENGKVTRG